MSETLSLSEVAVRTGIHKRTIYNQLSRGDFPVQPLPRIRPRRWSTEAVDAWLRGEV